MWTTVISLQTETLPIRVFQPNSYLNPELSPTFVKIHQTKQISEAMHLHLSDPVDLPSTKMR